MAAPRATVFFLDGPASALDLEAVRVVRDFIEALSGQGHTIFGGTI